MEGTFCEDCGIFLKAEPSKYVERCHDCHEEELHRAAEEGYCPDGIRFADWSEIQHKYKEPEFVEWQYKKPAASTADSSVPCGGERK